MSDALRAFFSRLQAIFSRTQLDEDFNEELAAHVDLLAAENEKAGMAPEEARRSALVRLGGRELTREIHRETRGLPFLEIFWQDFRYALRTLRRDARFFIAAVYIAGLGIGASVTIFSVVNTLLLRPLPFQEPHALSGSPMTTGEAVGYRHKPYRSTLSWSSARRTNRFPIWPRILRSTEWATAS